MDNVGRHQTAVVSPVTSVTYTADAIDQITLSWTNPTYQERTYIEYYASGDWRAVYPDGGTYMGDNVTTWTMTSADTYAYNGSTAFSPTQNKYHLFRLRAYQGGIYSAYTNVTAYTKPGPPVDIASTAISDETITASWTNPAGSGLTETFKVEWGTTTSYGSDITTSTTVSSYPITPLNPSTLYYIRVRTITSAGESSTVTTSATTAAGPDPVFGDELSLGGLGHATGNSDDDDTSDMNTISGGTSEVSMRDFFCGGVSSTLAGSTYVSIGGGQEQLSMVFSNVGNQFLSKIADRADQFTWSSSASSIIGVTAGDYQATVTGNGSVGQQAVITCVWDANYNETHDNISSNRTATKTVTVGFEM
jgi:hypothetical protein